MIVNRKTIGQPTPPDIPEDELEAMVQARMLALQGLDEPAPLPSEEEPLPLLP